MLDRLTDEAIETLLARHAAGRAPVRELHLHQGGGAMATAPAGTALPTAARPTSATSSPVRLTARASTSTSTGPGPPTRRWTHGAPAATSTSPPNQDRTRSRPPTHLIPTPAWSMSRTDTTRPTCSGSTKTSPHWQPLIDSEAGRNSDRAGEVHHGGIPRGNEERPIERIVSCHSQVAAHPRRSWTARLPTATGSPRPWTRSPPSRHRACRSRLWA